MIVTPVSGPPRERGEAIGRAHRDAIERLIGLRATPASAIWPYAECVRRQLPAIAAEVTGLAAGSGIATEDAWWLQLRRELHPHPAADCTTAAYPQAGLLGQTIDLPPELGQGLHALDISPEISPETGPSIAPETEHPGAAAGHPAALVISFAGLLGYLGINSAGLAVGINMVQSADWGVGVPPYLLVRAVLQCRSLDRAIELLRRVPRASSRCLTLLAGREAVLVQMTATELRTSTGGALTMTNHFTHPELTSLDTSDPSARMESRLRRRRLQTRLGPAAPDLAGLQNTLLDAAFQVNPAGPGQVAAPGALATVATVVLEPEAGVIHVRPRGGDWQSITGGWAA